MPTVFYSWQSDLPNNTNRRFIHDCVERAIAEVRRELELQEAQRDESQGLELREGVSSRPGSPFIAEEIFRQIDECGIFVSDVSIVTPQGSGRPCPNPNVMIEHGRATGSVGTERMVSVFNDAFGNVADDLPFDMRHRRWPIRYTLPENPTPEQRDAARSGLVRDLTTAFRAIIEEGLLDQAEESPTPFVPVKFTTDRSNFLRRDEPVAIITARRPHKTFMLADAPAKMYLRLQPTTGLPEIEPEEAIALITRSGLGPMRGPEGCLGFDAERNEHGAVAFFHGTTSGAAITLTQVHRNREIWGIDALALDTEEEGRYIPSIYMEEVFDFTFYQYARFAYEFLNMPLPWGIECGLTNVRGFRMSRGQYIRGNVVENEIVWRGTVNETGQITQSFLVPFYDRVWSKCGLERPPEGVGARQIETALSDDTLCRAAD